MLTPLQKYHQNRNLIKRYFNFVKHDPIDDTEKLKVITEIGRLNLQNEAIKQLSKKEMKQFSYETITVEIESQW